MDEHMEIFKDAWQRFPGVSRAVVSSLLLQGMREGRKNERKKCVDELLEQHEYFQKRDGIKVSYFIAAEVLRTNAIENEKSVAKKIMDFINNPAEAGEDE